MWDDCLVDFVAGPARCVTHTTDQQVDRLAAWLMKQMRRQDSHAYRSTGDFHQWPEEWATDSPGSLATANSMEVTRET